MNTNILAVLIQQGGQLFSELLRNRGTNMSQPSVESMEKFLEESDSRMKPYITPLDLGDLMIEPAKEATINIRVDNTEQKEEVANKATSIATGCIPCATGHLGVCSGIISESVRFSHGEEGIASPEVIDRVSMCLDELNAMERVDLRPEMTTQLKGWEKDLANKVLSESRSIRHELEGMKKVDDLEKVAAKIQTTRKDIGREWFQNKLNSMSPDEKEEVNRRVAGKIKEIEEE